MLGNLDIVLNVVCLNLKNGEFYCLDDDGTPNENYKMSINEACCNIIKKYTDIDPAWIDFVLYKVEDAIVPRIHYYCIIPEKLKLKQGKWVKIDDYELIQQIQKSI